MGESKEEQNTNAERERARERDEGVFMLLRTGCESEMMERKN